MSMKIIISNSSDMPIYRQIADAVKEEILSDNLHEGDPLPSIRTIARELSVSVITAKKAYEELEAMGYIKGQQGRGFFVSKKSRELAKEHKISEMEQHILSAIDICGELGLSKEELMGTVETLYDGNFLNE